MKQSNDIIICDVCDRIIHKDYKTMKKRNIVDKINGFVKWYYFQRDSKDVCYKCIKSFEKWCKERKE